MKMRLAPRIADFRGLWTVIAAAIIDAMPFRALAGARSGPFRSIGSGCAWAA
jgi:hypothetical protein